jgi:hypothetical protein
MLTVRLIICNSPFLSLLDFFFFVKVVILIYAYYFTARIICHFDLNVRRQILIIRIIVYDFL